MPGLGERIRELRESAARLTRKRVGEELGFSGRSAEQTVYEWETGRRQLPAAEVPALAKALGVTICGLYGVDEGHQVPPTLSLAEQLAKALGVEPARVEVNVYGADVVGRDREGRPFAMQAKASSEFNPTAADRDTRDIVRAWDAMPQEVQQEWLETAERLRKEQEA